MKGLPPGGSRHIKRILTWAAIDIAIVWAAYTMAFFARALTSTLVYFQSVGFILLAVSIQVVFNYLFGVYYHIWARSSGHEVILLVYSTAAAAVSTVAINLALASPERPLPLSVIMVGSMLGIMGMVGVRYRSRLVTGLSWRWYTLWHGQVPEGDVHMTPVLIVGAGESGQTFVWRLKHRWHAEHKYHVIGFVDDDPDKRGLYIEGTQVMGGRADIPRLVEQYDVELIVLAIHNISGPDFREILAYCESTPARIKVVPNTLALMDAKHGVSLLRDVLPEDILGRKIVDRHAGVDLTPITRKVILVTGAAGSIGSELSRQLLDYDPIRLLVLDNNESGLHDLCVELMASAPQAVIVPLLADVTNRRTLEALFIRYRPQVVFHAAAYKHVPMLQSFPSEGVRVNVHGTRTLADLARQYEVERFVLISTDKAVDPSSVMGATKRLGELLMHAYAQENNHRTLFTSVRFGNVLASRGSVVPTFERQIDQGGPVTVTHKDMTRYFMTIAEAVNLVLHAACLTRGNDLYMLRMGEVVRIVDLAERMIRLRGLRPYEDIPIVFTGTRPGEKLHETLQLKSEVAVATAHPHIVQLINQESRFRGQFLLQQVEALVASVDASTPEAALQHSLDDGASALARIRECIRQAYDVTPEAEQPSPVEEAAQNLSAATPAIPPWLEASQSADGLVQ